MDVRVPSAPTITTILARRYVTKENKNLYVTELGEAVNGIMKKCFPSIVDLSFTANMELLLDKVADGTVKWKTIIVEFLPGSGSGCGNRREDVGVREDRGRSIRRHLRCMWTEYGSQIRPARQIPGLPGLPGV